MQLLCILSTTLLPLHSTFYCICSSSDYFDHELMCSFNYSPGPCFFFFFFIPSPFSSLTTFILSYLSALFRACRFCCTILVYCPFPGFLESGRVLLVGHMGMYDYRPYVRKVTNNKQIVYECDRGYYVFGAPAATCVDGQWSPRELPKCLRGSHPNILMMGLKRRRRSSSSYSSQSNRKPDIFDTRSQLPLLTSNSNKEGSSARVGASASAVSQELTTTTANPVARDRRSLLKSRVPAVISSYQVLTVSHTNTSNLANSNLEGTDTAHSVTRAKPLRLFWRNLRGRRHPRAKGQSLAMSVVRVISFWPCSYFARHACMLHTCMS